MSKINIFNHAREAFGVAAGETLFKEGDAGDAMYSVVEGRVDLVRGDDVVESVESGGILGEMALVDSAPRSAAAVVAEASRLVRVDEKHFQLLVQQHPTFALQVMGVMAERLRRANESRAEL